ncbi:hypothetical protein TNCV_1474891 [Trichonephila clavipes]|nr:hypothetical protein TNCV_1474891 [Trichonephila clavipes]
MDSIKSSKSWSKKSSVALSNSAGYPRVIPETEVTRRLAKHRYSQLRIAPNPRIIHPKITRGFYSPISEAVEPPLVKLVEGEERWEAPDYPQGVLPRYWGGTEQNCTVTCMVLKATNCTRAIGDGPRNFEPWASDEDDTTSGTPSPSFHTTPTGRHLSLDLFNVQRPLLQDGSSTVLGSNP